MRRFALAVLLAAIAALALPLAAQAAPVFVSVVGSDTAGDGSALNPYATVQHAIDTASSGDEVRVGAGTFTGNIAMKDGVSLYGAGAGDAILQGTGSGPVVSAVGVSGVIDGFSITGGNVTGDAYGGGIACNGSAVTISHNAILANHGTYGGGVGCSNGAITTIVHNTISGNSAGYGGGIGVSGGTQTIADNVVCGNTAGAAGGGIELTSCYASITDNVLWGNTASSGGGLEFNSCPGVTLRHDTIVDNQAATAGGVFAISCTPNIISCIVWGNGDDLYGCSAMYSDVEDLDEGTGNISAAPSFVATATHDYRLSAGSPCIDCAAGEGYAAKDVSGVKRPQGSGVDMGAFEYYDPAAAAPADPTLVSPSHTVSTWSSDATIAISLSGASSSVADLAGFAIALSKNATSDPGASVTDAAETTSCLLAAPSDGIWYVNLVTADVLGNRSVGTSFGPVWIDTTAPTTTDDHLATYVGSALVSLSATDAASGVAATTWTLDGVPGTGSVVATSAVGSHELAYSSTDAIGNAETTHTVSFTIQPLPVQAAVSAPRTSGKVSRKRAVRFVGAIFPAHVASVRVEIQRLSGGKYRRYKTVTLTTGASGAYSFKLRLKAGRYRLRASAPAMSGYLAAPASAWRKVRVR
jgi:hypothetical protein